MRLLRGLNIFSSLPSTMNSCQMRAQSLVQAHLAGRMSSKTSSKQGRLLNRLHCMVATDVQLWQHPWSFKSPVVNNCALSSFGSAPNALAPFATCAASGSLDRLQKVEGLKLGVSSPGVQISGGTQHNWSKTLFGSGLAAAGVAALCASAVRTDAAECETPGSGENEDTQRDGRERRQLYPPIEPHTSGYLQVSDLHKIYWEESGNPNGQPVIFLHGGPGAGTSPNNRRFFDPDFYRIILVDQRGAGKSIPHASLVDNTTWHLVEDLEKLREILKIDKWLVFGGSWGSTLSLAYAETHPERVVGLVLRGIFMIRRHEINWFYQRGADHIFPDAWEAYRDFIPPEERSGLVAAYHRRLMNDKDPETQLAAARAWTAWEMATAYLRPSRESKERGEDDKFALAFARIENHYFVNGGFFPSDSWLLDNVSKLRTIPAVIIQGRYDVVCPMTSAWDLHKAWPEADFRVVPDAGHSANEVGIGAELVAATERMKRLYAGGNPVESS